MELAYLTEEYGGKAVNMMNLMMKGLVKKERVIEAYEGFRLNRSVVESANNSSLASSPRD